MMVGWKKVGARECFGARCVVATLLLLCSLGGVSYADTVTATFSFEKRPPRSAVLYAIDGDHKPIAEIEIDQKEKEFEKPMHVISPGAKVTFKNSDDMDHNIFSGKVGEPVGFDIGLIAPGAEVERNLDWEVKTFQRLGCKIHPKMRTYVVSVPNSAYLALPFREAGLQERYELSVDASTTKIGLMAYRYEPIELALAKGETVTVDLIRKGAVRGQVTLARGD